MWVSLVKIRIAGSQRVVDPEDPMLLRLLSSNILGASRLTVRWPYPKYLGRHC